jgi:hypothetical protein
MIAQAMKTRIESPAPWLNFSSPDDSAISRESCDIWDTPWGKKAEKS